MAPGVLIMQEGIPILLTLDEQRRTLQQDMIPAVRDTIILRIPELARYVVQTGVEGQYRGVTLGVRTRGVKSVNLIPPVETWSVDGNDITAEIALSSAELNELFRFVSDRGTRTLTVVVELDFPRRVLALGDFILRNNPVRDGGDETHPSPTVAQLLAALRDELESVAALMLRHGHDGVETQHVLHSALLGVGVLTHEKIDKALADSYPVNLRILNSIKNHDRAHDSHKTRFADVENAHKNHVASDAATDNNVHGIVAAIAKAITGHDNHTLSHADLRALISALPTLLDVANAVTGHNTSPMSHTDLRTLVAALPTLVDMANIVATHNTNATAHSTRFATVETTHQNHVALDASTGSNVHGILTAINALVTAHNANSLSHNDLRTLLEGVLELVQGIDFGRAFDTETEMFAWLANPKNTEALHVGYALFVRDPDAPDYWWDGGKPLVNDTKTDLSGYATSDEMAQELAKLEADILNTLPADIVTLPDIEAVRVTVLYEDIRRVIGLSVFSENSKQQSDLQSVVKTQGTP